jgi:maltooligosyltrehalose trehalohydrolase
MPFGATIEDGATRFRLWAPGAHEVAVVLGSSGHDARPMAALDSGWFEARVPDAPAGTRYALRIDGGSAVPDPASRSNPDGVHAPSEVVDPLSYEWQHDGWRGRPWEQAVLYELHIGTFTPAGTFAAAAEHFGRLADLGVTAIELMPIAAFPGDRNWGYDGVLPFSPTRSYGTPDDLKRMVDAAHGHGLMVLLDVVYNHFGPEGNYLHVYAPQFFNPRHQTPWGAAINFDGDHSRTVRDFFIHNALYWIDEYRLDGLRLDAVHAIADDSRPDILSELAETVRRHAGGERHVHIVLENDRNEARRLARDASGKPRQATAQWNDDFHHALHVLVTGERDGYYADYAEQPLAQLGRCLAEGFAYQGEPSLFRGGDARGEPSADLPAGAFVSFTQTHDQVGNRAFGERLATLADPRALRAAVSLSLLALSPPMLFMGEEFGASTPFLFFGDFGPELAGAVARGRRAEFGEFERFRNPATQASIPDPNAQATFAASKLDWSEAGTPTGVESLEFYRRCLGLRHQHVVPRVSNAAQGGSFEVARASLLRVRWRLADGATLHAGANFASTPLARVERQPGTPLYESDAGIAAGGMWPAYAVVFSLEEVT